MAEPILMQDENSGRDGRRFNEWFASRPDARLRAREAAAAISAQRSQRVTPEMLEQQAAMVEMVAGVEANLARIRKAIDKAKEPSTPSPAPKE